MTKRVSFLPLVIAAVFLETNANAHTQQKQESLSSAVQGVITDATTQQEDWEPPPLDLDQALSDISGFQSDVGAPLQRRRNDERNNRPQRRKDQGHPHSPVHSRGRSDSTFPGRVQGQDDRHLSGRRQGYDAKDGYGIDRVPDDRFPSSDGSRGVLVSVNLNPERGERNTGISNSRNFIGNLGDFLSNIYSGHRNRYPFPGQRQENLVQDEITPPHSNERIRLRGENGFYDAGIVEVYRAGRWGLVCDDHWDLKDATVACRQLGFKQGAKGAPTESYYGVPAGRWSDDDVLMDDITCDGDESSLQQCNYKITHDCKVSEAASVVCSSNDICPDAWISGLDTCYQFFGGVANINAAEAKCNSLNASLVSVDSPEENHFLSNIITLSSAVKTNHLWYTSGRNNRGQWNWQKNVFTTPAAQTRVNRGKNNKLNKRPGRRTKQSVRSQVDAMRWFPGWNPSRYAKEPSLSKGHNCLVLSDMYDLPNGTMASVDYYYFKTAPCNQGKQKINFICEMTPKKPIKECYTNNGSDYRGTISQTENATPCIPWTFVTVKDPSKGIDDYNYCRNPDNDKKPWCWVSLGKFGYCPVPKCSQVTAVTTTTPAPDSFNCPANEFFCFVENTCIPEIYHCDGESDCAAAEDEQNCVYPSSMFVEYPHKMPQEMITNITYNNIPFETCASFCVKSTFFVCISFLFNPNNRLCQILDLAGGSQVTLVYSVNYTYYVMSTQYDNCTGRFRCNNNRCISQQLVCNDHDDCGDLSEESNCGTERPPAVRVRLSGGDEHSGRVEVFYMNEWGMVCDDSWDIRDARVVCRMLGYPGAVRATTGSEFGQGQGDTLLDEVECTGNETSLQDCPASPWKQHDCFSFENAGVECSINKSCEITQHRCSDTELCVDAVNVCDGTPECPDRSDERNCELRVELVNGTGHYEGRVELVRNGLRGTVCDDEWGEAEADVICRMLGYRYGGEPLTDTDFGSGIGIIWMDNVNCLGNESSLAFCSHSGWTVNDCSHPEDAGVRCHVTRPTTMILPTTTISSTAERACEITQHKCSDIELCVDAVNVCDGTPECPDGSDDRNCELRVELVNGTDRYEGRVELVRNGLRGTVCDDEWGKAEADVICRMLGYRYGGEPLTQASFGSGVGIIWMDNVNCLGNESSLAFCSHSGWTVNDCNHLEDAGVRCHVTRPTTTTQSTTTSFTAERACEITQHKCSDIELCVDAVEVCDGTSECPDGSDERNCELRVELVNGTGRYEGRVELVRNGLRGTVCDDEWGKAEADVICRMLGYRYGGEPSTQASFGNGTGIIWMDNVDCLGNESSVVFCSHSGWTVNDCSHLEDAGVRCHVTRPTATSFTAEKELRVELVNGMGRHEGRVELVRNGLRGTVCDDEWEKAEADVVCRMLGYRYGGEPLTQASFGSGTGIIWMDNVNCLGNESSLAFCSHSGWTVNDCSHLEDAGVRCHVTRPTTTTQSTTTAPFTVERACEIYQFRCFGTDLCVDAVEICDGTPECPDGSDERNCELRVELVNGTGRYEGRVELVRNGLRGTVCDDEWGKAEADVICRMLGYRYGGEPLTQASFGSGTGIIWMDNVNCLGNESSLAFCSHSGWTVNDCSHLEDAGVRCYVTRPTTTTQSMTTTSFTTERACEIIQHRCFGTKLCVDAFEVCDGTPKCPDGSDERNCELRVELVNGTGRYEGRVELVRNGLRGTVCDDEWGKAEADVICRMLGYRYGGEPLKEADFGKGIGIIWMDNVNCLGNESSLAFCYHSGWTVNDCNHLEDAGVRCHVTRPTTTTLPTTTTSCTAERVRVYLVAGATPNEGRVELAFGSFRGTICDDSWDDADATVICRMAGYTNGGKAVLNGQYGAGSASLDILLDEVNCDGTESCITQCQHLGLLNHNCDHSEDAGVVCHVTGSEDNEQIGVGQQTVSSRSTTTSITPTSIFDEPCGLRPLYRSRRQAFTPSLNDSGLRELQPSGTRKIVGGLMALHGEYPWQVGVAKIFSILVTGNVMVSHSCGATIISKHWVLSAAHCFENIPKSRVILRVGDYGHKTNDEGEQTFEVEELIMHENYDTDTHDYDIALLKVKSEDAQGIKLNDYAQPACLPAPGIIYTPSMPSCFISGWGETGYGSPSFLRGARVPILGWNFCNRLYKNALTSRMICAGNIQGGTDTCQGDSGGPLVCKINGVYTLMGVTSWGFGCAKPNSPGVYTNVVEFLTWIEGTVRRNS